MILSSEREFRQAVQIGAATAICLWGFPILGIILILLILPWHPFYRVASYFGSVLLGARAKRCVKRAMRKLSEQPQPVEAV